MPRGRGGTCAGREAREQRRTSGSYYSCVTSPLSVAPYPDTIATPGSCRKASDTKPRAYTRGSAGNQQLEACDRRAFGTLLQGLVMETLNPKLYTRNPNQQLEGWNRRALSTHTLIRKPFTLHPSPFTLHLEP